MKSNRKMAWRSVFIVSLLGVLSSAGMQSFRLEAQTVRFLGRQSFESADSLTDFEGEPISLKLVNARLVDFFRAISELSNLNVLIDPDVRGTITINVEEIPWDQLFDVVLRSHRLEQSIDGSLVRISTKATLQREQNAKRTLKRAELLAADTITVSRRLNYADAGQINSALDGERSFISTRGELVIDRRTNTVFITDVEEYVEKFLELLDTIDIPELQVEIEARIIEATTNFARDIGFSFGFNVGSPVDRNTGGFQSFAPTPSPIGVGSFLNGFLLDTVRLDAMITAAEREGEARVLSKPRVSAQNNSQAIITQGSRIPIPVTRNFSTSVRFETAALRLTVTPQITEDRTISLKIKVENNIPDFSRTVLGIPTILTSEAQTMVLVPDGGTTVIGGIFVEADRSSEDKVPVLGDIPVLGNLFKRSKESRETREILFFLTPKIKK